MYISTIQRCIEIIIEIDAASKAGQFIGYCKNDKEHRVIWTSYDMHECYMQKWHIGFNWLRSLEQSKNDARFHFVSAFITGHLTASEALDYIKRSEKLKAFW